MGCERVHQSVCEGRIFYLIFFFLEVIFKENMNIVKKKFKR